MLINKNKTVSKGTKAAVILVLSLIINVASFGQIDNSAISGVKQNSIDTLAMQTTQKAVKETEGLLEREIDPEKYVLGPNDILNISIISSKTRQYEVIISPDGKLVIPEVGAVDLKNKTLAQAEILIKEKIKKFIKTDEIYITLKDLRKFKVIVGGFVSKPGIVAATAVDRVSEVIDKIGGIKYSGSMRKIALHRDSNTSAIYIDLVKFYLLGDKSQNITVLGGDRINVPPINNNESIEISGEVGAPGTFEFVIGDSLSTLIKFAQGFLESSFLDSVEIVRFIGNTKQTETIFLDLSSWRNNINQKVRLENDIPLKSGDRVYIRKFTGWKKPYFVAIGGAINYPGRYAIGLNSTKIKELIIRAGGTTDEAAIENALLFREVDWDRTDAELERLKNMRMSDMTDAEKDYYRSRIFENKGVKQLNIKQIMANNEYEDNISLNNRDSIYVPQKKQLVNIQGRVNKPGLYVYHPGFKYEDYIELAGGYGYKADKGATLIMKPKGEQYLASDDNKYAIEPGDNILVPPKSETNYIEYLTIATQILTVVGIVAALIK